MSNFVIFVPEHIDLNSIDKCFRDSKAYFFNINSSDFDASAMIKIFGDFIVLETDYFVIYLAPPEHNRQSEMASFKCSYSIRNWVMSNVRYNYNLHQGFIVGYNGIITEVDGILNVNQPPVLYFASRDNADCLASSNSAEYHTIVEYFEDDDGIDLAKLGEIAKTKTCVPHFFVVNKAADYYAVDTNDTDIRYKFSAAIKYKIITEMARGRRTIEDCYEEDRKIAERLSEMRFDPDFQLRDREGVPLDEGCLFSLQIVDDDDDKDYEDDDAEHERELNYVEFIGKTQKGKICFHGYKRSAAIFGFKVVDGITYLTYSDGYVYLSSIEGIEMAVGPRIPANSQRIRFVYTESGDISLFTWDGSIFATCNWMNETYGAIWFERYEYSMRWGKPMRLQIELYHDTRVEKED